jgi:hypothetical protein
MSAAVAALFFKFLFSLHALSGIIAVYTGIVKAYIPFRE